jgi:tripartite-type tricarboxylate transporter receptor subunit TctC
MKKIVFGFVLLIAPASALHAQASFFEGKTVRILVGFSPGGTYDLWARLLAHHMSKHIPGNPTFVVQNMTGGGSMIAAIISIMSPSPTA